MATTFSCTYATSTATSFPRQGLRNVDIDGISGFQRDSSGGLFTTSGLDRMVNRVVVALLNVLASWPLDPEWGSIAIPGLPISDNISLRVGFVGVREARLYNSSQFVSPGNRCTNVVTESVQPSSNPQTATVYVSLYFNNAPLLPVEIREVI